MSVPAPVRSWKQRRAAARNTVQADKKLNETYQKRD